MKTILLWLLPFLAAGCSSARTYTLDPMRVETLVVQTGTDLDTKTYVGTIEGGMTAAVSFPLSGTVVRTYADEGQRVGCGQPLAQLNDATARQACQASRASLDQARDAYDRLRKLYDSNSLPQIKWVEAQTRLSQAEAMFAVAEKNLNDCLLTAPFAGIVGKRITSVGETVMPGSPVMTLLSTDTVTVRFSVPELEIAGLGTDSRLRITVPALGEKVFTTNRVEKGIVANPVAHTYDARAVIANPDGALLPGMVCRVEASPAVSAARIAIPLRAVQQAGDGSRFVWKVQGDSVVRTPVATGQFSGNDIHIVAGLQSGDRVVTAGMQKVGEGSKVTWE